MNPQHPSTNPQDLWSAVDEYLAGALIPCDPVLDAALQANRAAGLPAIDVAPNQGRLLNLLARIQGARRILEIGTLGGYSTICLARALPAEGRLITLESSPRHAEVARQNIARAGLSGAVELRLGPALQSLARLQQEGASPFDFIFIDADKENIPGYLEASLRLSRPGAVIVCDNVVRDGGILEADSTDPSIQGVRRFYELVSADPSLEATALQTVGSKGYDGFALVRVRQP